MSLLKLSDISLAYGTHVLLDGVDLNIERGDRIGLLGRNGAGKSTLLKVLSGALKPESGERWLAPATRIASLAQTLPSASNETVYDVVAAGLADVGKLLARYHHLALAASESALDELAAIQQELEVKDGWTLGQQVETTLSQLQLPADTPMTELSGGWRRRVALAQALVGKPDLLLLDEPTNHLDIPTITWLEQQLQNYSGALVLITHDRAFLQQLATSIAELDRGHLHLWRGDYQGFLRYNEERLHAEEKANALFDKKLAQEEVWIRQGIKARRTRNEGRVRALKAMREERSERRVQQGKASFDIGAASASGKIVAEVNEVSLSLGDKTIVKDFSTIIQRGDRIGIVGANGAGKTTLVRLLLGELAPDSGRVKLGTKLEVAYSDQLRGSLDPEKNLIDNICGGRDSIEINGQQRHGMSYLGDFLFTPERIRTPFKALSGGEQNRATLAQLFSKPANLLVLDEPTNDLDMETLELLEERLLAFEGTVILVSHDRAFMDNVVTSLLVLKGNGAIEEQAGGYSDWLARGGKLTEADTMIAAKKPNRTEKTAKPKPQEPAQKRKLSYKEQRELDALPDTIDALEQKIAELETQTHAPRFYQQDHAAVQATLQQLADTQTELDTALERWTELED